MKFSHTTTAPIIACILLLPACGSQYQKAQLKPLDTKTSSYLETKNGITLSASTLSAKESGKIFGSKGRYLEKSGIIPVQISIANNSGDTVTFEPTKVNAPFADSKKVASTLGKNPSRTASGIIVAGAFAFLLTGLAGALCGFIYALTGQALWTLGFIPAAAVLIITPTSSVYYYNKISSSNAALSQDIKSMSQVASIAPGKTLDTVLFLDKTQFKGTLSVPLNASLSSTTFNIDLQK